MPFSGSGLYQRVHNFVNEVAQGLTTIRADRMDAEFDGIVGAINSVTAGDIPFRGAIKLVNGSTALPALAFADQPNSGVVHLGGGSIGLVSDGELIVTIKPSGLYLGTDNLRDELVSAYDNKILNGDFSIDRDGGSTRTPGGGVYTFDIWRGHVDGLEQIVEALPAGDYTLVFEGGGTGYVNGQAPAESPAVFNVATAGDTSVVVPADATGVMLLSGDQTDTPNLIFEPRPRQIEETLLSRYYIPNVRLCATGYAEAANQTARCLMQVNFPTEMRVVPAFSHELNDNDNVWNSPAGGVWRVDKSGAAMSPISKAAGGTFWEGKGHFDARF